MPRIPVSVIEEIKERNPIEDVVSRYVSLKRAGKDLSCPCPFHSERTPSFYVIPSKQMFYCFGCGAGGDVVSFLMRIENLEYPDALRQLAERAGISIPDDDGTPGEHGVSRKRIFDMNRDAARYFRDMLFDEVKGAEARRYLVDRGLSMSVIKRFGLGYAPEDFMMSRHLRELGYTDEELVAGFLCKRSEKTGRPFDLFRGRVMFPIIDTSGRVIAFGGRVMGDAKPKYLNSSDTPVFKKSKNLFALNYAKSSCSEEMILCEGYMDVIALHAVGVENAIATLGTALTPEQARIMAKYTKRVVISYDSDEAGQRAAARAIELLSEVGLDVRVLKLKGAKDPDEFVKKFGVDAFRDALSASSPKFTHTMRAITAKYNMSQDEEKIRAMREINEYIAGIGSGVEREIYIRQVSAELGISEESIKNDVSLIINKKRRQQKKTEAADVAQKTSGVGDRVNRDKLTKLRAASCEEAVIGMLVAYPEYIKDAAGDGKLALGAEDFMTEFGRRVFVAISEVYRESGGFDIGALAGDFTQDEMSRIVKLGVGRDRLDNSREVFAENIRALREERERQESKKEDAFDAIRRIREKNKGNT